MDAIKDTLTQSYTTAKRALSSAPPNDAYLQWNAPGVEEIKSDEEAKAQEIADTMNKMQKHNFDKVRHAMLNISHPLLSSGLTPTLASSCLQGNPRQDPRPDQRHPERSLRPPSSPEARPVCNSRNIPRSGPLRQRARLPPRRQRARSARHGDKNIQRQG